MAWSKGKTAAAAVTGVIILCGAVTIWINSGALSGPDTMAKINGLPRIYSNGINNAHRLADPLYTYPAGDERTRLYIMALFKKFRPATDPVGAIKSDRELTEQDIQNRTLFIYGSPENHSLFRKLRDQLPLLFESDGVVVGKKKCLGRDVGAIFTCPNPLNPARQLVIYGAVSPEALKNMNSVFHGPTDYVVFNDTTRQFKGMEAIDCFLLLGAFDKSDPAHWRVDEKLQLLPPKKLQRATARVVVGR
jgi:hypothetical protein